MISQLNYSCISAESLRSFVYSHHVNKSSFYLYYRVPSLAKNGYADDGWEPATVKKPAVPAFINLEPLMVYNRVLPGVRGRFYSGYLLRNVVDKRRCHQRFGITTVDQLLEPSYMNCDRHDIVRLLPRIRQHQKSSTESASCDRQNKSMALKYS